MSIAMAKLKMSLKADSGYESESEHRITAEQWGDVNRVLHGKKPSALPLELQPCEELIALAEKLQSTTPAHWTAGEKKALLGFLNLHIGHHTMASRSAATELIPSK